MRISDWSSDVCSSDLLIKIDEPVVKVFKVDSVTIDRHEKAGSPPMMKVSYYCGYKSFSEFICVQHTNFAGRKARKWWGERTDTPMPETTAEAIAIADQVLAAPTPLRVWTNKQYPAIMAFCHYGPTFRT